MESVETYPGGGNCSTWRSLRRFRFSGGARLGGAGGSRGPATGLGVLMNLQGDLPTRMARTCAEGEGMKLLSWCLATFLAAGCATGPHWSEEWAAKVSRVYAVPPVAVVALGEVTMDGAWAVYNAGPPARITVRPLVWSVPVEQQMRLLAHEFAHHVLGHRSASPENETAADLKGVEILQRIEGLSEREAFRIFYDHRWGRIRDLHRRTPAGHPEDCARLAAFLRAYPAQTWARGC